VVEIYVMGWRLPSNHVIITSEILKTVYMPCATLWNGTSIFTLEAQCSDAIYGPRFHVGEVESIFAAIPSRASNHFGFVHVSVKS
jgi:hypothetical protein